MKIKASTSCAAVIGHPIEHSLSPILHNTIYRTLGLDIVYMAFDVSDDNLERAVEGLAALNFLGFNVTIPYKERIIRLLDRIDPIAAGIGAVNTVKVEKGQLIGYNTDGLGFLDSLKVNNIEWHQRSILIIGAGGSARAIGISLVEQEPKKIHILNRSMERAKQLAKDINEFAGYNLSSVVRDIPDNIDIIVNTTPLGMWPKTNQSPLDGYNFNPQTIVCDIVYNPYKTYLLKQAEERGCTTVKGIGMLIGQGVQAIEIWTGQEIHHSIIKSLYNEIHISLAK
ncbi:MAG: shikimate dehydrogenase [Clostridiales bacterium]|nr:shikimate dehydrogenase [Clostridiales bacterium]